MSVETMRASATAAFQTAWAYRFPDIPVKYENSRFKQPASAWVSFQVLESDARRANVGTTKRFTRDEGFVVVEFYAVEETGTKLLNDMIDYAATIFDDRRFTLSDGDYVTYYSGKKTTQGQDAGFYKKTLITMFYRDSCRDAVA
jgi:Bacteriophage related domain of unknown function